LCEKIILNCQESNRKSRKGFISALINMANDINENCDEMEDIKAIISKSLFYKIIL